MNSSTDQKPLPLETLLPFPTQKRPSQSLEALRDALQQAQEEAEAESRRDEEGSGDDKAPKRPKRARACNACRGMKIRCLPVENQQACLACSKVNRECIMPGPARKRQKTVHKVAELEKKINALTDALIAKNGTGPTPPNDSPANDRNESQSDVTRSEIDPRSPEKLADRSTKDDRPLLPIMPSLAKGDLDWGCSRFGRRNVVEAPYIDPIDRGLIDLDTAVAVFDHYVSKMLPLFPFVCFPHYVKAQDVRAGRPTLFLAILSVASSAIRPDLQPGLVIEINRQLSERILFTGEKSLELLQATQLYTAYYVRSKFAKDLAFNQYIHAALVMALDMGVGKRYPKQHLKGGVEEAEVRRVWLACYYSGSSVSTLMRHPSLVRWSNYIEECLLFFKTSPDALPSDAWLCSLARCQKICEDVNNVFSLDDAITNIGFNEARTQFHLKAFEKQLSEWRESAPSYVDRRLVEHLASSLNLYIHEIAIHNDHGVEDFRYEHSSSHGHSEVTAVHIDALTTCMDSCHRVLDSYLDLEIEFARVIPNLFIVWNTYALVGLIKLDGLLRAPDSAFGTIFMPNLRVDYYLSSTLRKLSDISAGGRWPPAEAFVFVTRKLASWHHHKRAPWVAEDGSTQQPPDTQQMQEEGLSYRSPEENKASDAATTSMMRGFSRSVGLPETYGKPTSAALQNTMNPGFDASGAMAPPTPNSQGLFGFAADQTSDFNAAYNAANYNLNWEELNFSQQEMNVFDTYMQDAGWMGYII